MTDPMLAIQTTTDPIQRLRIVIAADTFPPHINGAARFARDHAVRLSRRGHEVHVIAPSPTFVESSDTLESIDGQMIHVHRLRSIRVPRHEWARGPLPWEARRRSRLILDSIRPDVVHLQSFIDIGRGVAYEAHNRGIPIIATNHVMPDNLGSVRGVPPRTVPVLARVAWNLASTVYSRADIVTSPTPIAAEYLETHTSITGVTSISCGVDLTRFSRKHAKPLHNSILYVGRLDPEKNVTTLLEAFAMLDPGLGLGLDIVGGGSERVALEEHAQRLGISDVIRFHGRVSDERLAELHHAASVFVMPSTAELQSIATLEALATGTPVVLANAMALPHLASNGVEGYLVSAHDAAEFARRITSILTLPESSYTAMSERAAEQAARHEATAVVRQYEALYDAALRRSPGTRGHRQRGIRTRRTFMSFWRSGVEKLRNARLAPPKTTPQ